MEAGGLQLCLAEVWEVRASLTGCLLEMSHFRSPSGESELAPGFTYTRQEVTKSCLSVRYTRRDL